MYIGGVDAAAAVVQRRMDRVLKVLQAAGVDKETQSDVLLAAFDDGTTYTEQELKGIDNKRPFNENKRKQPQPSRRVVSQNVEISLLKRQRGLLKLYERMGGDIKLMARCLSAHKKDGKKVYPHEVVESLARIIDRAMRQIEVFENRLHGKQLNGLSLVLKPLEEYDKSNWPKWLIDLSNGLQSGQLIIVESGRVVLNQRFVADILK